MLRAPGKIAHPKIQTQTPGDCLELLAHSIARLLHQNLSPLFGKGGNMRGSAIESAHQ